jgi:hydrogenase large subunit
MMQLNLQVHDHIVHFYHLHALDWVNPVNALRADPRATSELAADGGPEPPDVEPGLFPRRAEPPARVRGKRPAGPVQERLLGQPRLLLPPEADLMAVTHYLEALDLQKEIVKIHTIFGGKNPHPNWLVGGVPCPINVHSTGAVGAINMERLNHVANGSSAERGVHQQRLHPGRDRHRRLLPQLAHGGGLSSQAVMSYGDIPEHANDFRPPTASCRAGAITNGDLSTVHEVDVATPSRSRNSSTILVRIRRARHGPASLGRCHRGEFRAGPQHRRQPHQYPRDRRGREVFVDQGPRWRGNAMEVGPLARYIVGYAKGHERITDQVTGLLRTMDLPVEALFSTLGRTAARALEAQYCAELQQHFFDKLMTNIIAMATKAPPMSRSGTLDLARLHPGRRLHRGTARRAGALGHDQEGRIENYQCVVPTTWNGSPRDSAGNIGAFEAAC